MKQVIVASHNPVKVRAVQEGFTRIFPGESFQFQGASVPSGVSAQPFDSAETLQGAYNRARNARALIPQADYWVGVEGGIEVSPAAAQLAADPGSSNEGRGISSGGMIAGSMDAGRMDAGSMAAGLMAAFAWVVVLSEQQVGKGRTGEFFLPPRVSELVHQGKELGEADDIVFGRSNSKQDNGAVGLLTGNVIDRAAFYEQAVILALIPFRNPELYRE